MAGSITHKKTDSIADWTQVELDAQIALGNYPPGTLLANIVLPSDWNDEHDVSGLVPYNDADSNVDLNNKDLTNVGNFQSNGIGTFNSAVYTDSILGLSGSTPGINMFAAQLQSASGDVVLDWNDTNNLIIGSSGTNNITFNPSLNNTTYNGANNIFPALAGFGAGVVGVDNDGKISFGSSSTGQTPWVSDIDADGFNLQDLGDIEFRGVGELKGIYMAFGATIFHGSGLNDLSFTGVYSGTGTPTYRFTVTDLNTQHISVDDASNIFVGDSISGDQSGSTGTVLSSDGSTEIVLGTITGNFFTDFSITDTTTSTFANVNSVDAFVDLGTFTDGTTTLTLQAIKGRSNSLQGVSYSAAAFTGHTVTNYWEMTITPTLGDGLKLDFGNNLFSMGDHEQIIYGNEFLTDIDSAISRWQMKDKTGTYFSMKAGQNPIFSSLGGSGSGRFVGLDNSGVMSNVASPLSIGSPVGGSAAEYFLFTDNTGHLKEGSISTGAQTMVSGTLSVYASAYIVKDLFGDLFFDFDLGAGAQAIRFGDLSGINSNMKLDMNLVSGDVLWDRVQNYTITADANFTLQNAGGGIGILGSMTPGAIAFQWGDLLATGNNTYQSITDSTATMLFSANARFYAGASNASQIYLDLNPTAATYAVGPTNFGNSSNITIDDTATTASVNNCNLNITTVGKTLGIKTGTNAKAGAATLSGGTVTISTTAITANSMIHLSVPRGTLTNLGIYKETARTAGTSFTIGSVNILDASTFDWWLVEKI